MPLDLWCSEADGIGIAIGHAPAADELPPVVGVNVPCRDNTSAGQDPLQVIDSPRCAHRPCSMQPSGMSAACRDARIEVTQILQCRVVWLQMRILKGLRTHLIVVDAHALGVAGVAAAQRIARAVPGQAQAADRVIGQDTALTVCAGEMQWESTYEGEHKRFIPRKT